MRRVFRFFIWSLVVLLIVAGVIFYKVTQSRSEIENWVGQQLLAIANKQLKPRLSFDELNYEYPATVRLRNLHLVADDPSAPGQTVEILGAQTAAITLAKMPRVGQPVVIERVELEKPLVSAVAVAPGQVDLIGFSDLLKRKPSSHPATGEAEEQLSDFLRMRLVQISDGKIVYDPRIAGTEPMTLDQINTQLNFTPSDKGWYALSMVVDRRPVFNFSAAGQINLDNLQLRDINLRVRADLNDNNLTYLPPQAQHWIEKYHVRGQLDAVVLGELPLNDPHAAKLDFSCDLRKANVVFGEYQLPVDRLLAAANFRDAHLNVTNCTLDGFHGALTTSGVLALNSALDCDLKLKVSKVRLEDFLAHGADAQTSKLVGQITVDAWLRGPLQHIIDRAGGRSDVTLPGSWGSAIVTITEGRLMNFKTIRAVLATIGVRELNNNDQASVAADCGGDIIQINDFRYVGKLLAARGKGTLTLDRKIDVLLNAGPIERVQVLLGSTIGSAVGSVTDRIVAYRVEGALADPHVHVEVADGSVGKVGGLFEGIGQGIGNLFKRE